MHDELTNLAREMLKNGSAAVLADFLENQDNDDADVVRALGTPDEVVRYLLPRYLPPTFVYECDFFPCCWCKSHMYSRRLLPYARIS